MGEIILPGLHRRDIASWCMRMKYATEGVQAGEALQTLSRQRKPVQEVGVHTAQFLHQLVQGPPGNLERNHEIQLPFLWVWMFRALMNFSPTPEGS